MFKSFFCEGLALSREGVRRIINVLLRKVREFGGSVRVRFFFFFQAEDGIRDLTVTGVQTCALPIWRESRAPACSAAGAAESRPAVPRRQRSPWEGAGRPACRLRSPGRLRWARGGVRLRGAGPGARAGDRKSTRLNSSHSQISYAVFCLKKKRK